MMTTIQNLEPANLLAVTGAEAITDTELEETIGVALIADYNKQLAGIAGEMQDNLNEKKSIRSELVSLQMIGTKDVSKIDGTQAYELTEDEANSLRQTYPDVFLIEEAQTTAIGKDNLESLLAAKQQELANVNSNSEMIALQIQSVINQRKEAVLMLSNLVASRSETMMSIARNLKV